MLDRRVFLRAGARATVGLAFCGARTPRAAAAEVPRFFLHVFIKGGADATYLFDARAAEFTTRGKLQNYRADKTIQPWTDDRGGSTWVSQLAHALAPYRGDFTVLNGVHMAEGFDGHPQNTAVAVTGSTSGGRLFATAWPREPELPLDFVSQGFLEGAETPSMESGVALPAIVARDLAARFRGAPAYDLSSPTLRFALARANALGQGAGALSTGSAALARALGGAGAIVDRQKQVQLCGAADGPTCAAVDEVFGDDAHAVDDGLKVAREYFRRRLAKSALLSIRYPIDTHDIAQAREQEATYRRVVQDLTRVLDFLRSPFDPDAGLSFGDVTTLLVTSEFSRTMLLPGRAVDATGTDHNPYTNTVLLAGRGVRKGLVVGATDLDQLDDRGNFTNVSGAHSSVDAEMLKPMGKPFDVETLQTRAVSPTTYAVGDYLSIMHVINTLLASFGAPTAAFKALERNGPPAPVLRGLMV